MSRIRILVLCLFNSVLNIACEYRSSKRKSIVIFAASSLQYIFGEERENLDMQHSNIDVQFQFSGSQTLATQIEHGAPADIFFSAHPTLMKRLSQQQYLVGDPIYFGYNELVVIQSPNFPALESFEDLPKAQSLILGQKNAPIGMYTEFVFEQMSSAWRDKVHLQVVSREANVANLRNKVLLGEIHCAIVYRSDAIMTGLPFLSIPKNIQPSIVYQVAYIQQQNRIIQPHVQEWVEAFLIDQKMKSNNH